MKAVLFLGLCNFGILGQKKPLALVFAKTVAVERYKRDRYERVLGKSCWTARMSTSSKSRQDWHGITGNMESPTIC
jgi:hypothetical protein